MRVSYHRIIVTFAIFLTSQTWGYCQQELARSLLRLSPVVGKQNIYQRKGTESIYRIARRYGVSASALHNANHGSLKEGNELLMIPTEHIAPIPTADGIVLNLPERNLYFYQDGRPVRCFPVAIGMPNWETPTGEFTIANKRKNPTWFPPKWAIQEKPVPPGPENPLGDRWMGLSLPGYGIHATNAPSSIGRYSSHGCVRMYPEHTHELYKLVRIGTPIMIIYERAVIGYRPEDGIVYLAYYPDPYQAGEVTADDIKRVLGDYDLAQVVDSVALEEALERTSGVPTPIVGSRVKVTINGKPVKFALAPTRQGDDWLVPAGPLAKALGAQIEVGPSMNYVSIEREGQRIFLSPGNVDALINGQLTQLDPGPQLAAGHPMIPLKATVSTLGASLGWDEETQTILVWDGLVHNGAEMLPEF